MKDVLQKDKDLVTKIKESDAFKKIENTYLGKLIIDFIGIYTTKNLGKSSASVAFYFTISIFPLLICVSWVIGSLDFNMSGYTDILNNFVPAGVLDILYNYFKELSTNNSIYLLLIGLYMTVKTMSTGFNNLVTSMDSIYKRKTYSGVIGIIITYLIPVLFLLVLAVGLILLLTGSWFVKLVDEILNIVFFAKNWNWIRFGLLFLILFFMFYLLYYYMAPKDNKIKKIIAKSALIGTLFFVAVSMVYSFLMSASANYSLVYGSLAAFIILMLWLSTLCLVIICGSIINYLMSKYEKESMEELKRESSIAEELKIGNSELAVIKENADKKKINSNIKASFVAVGIGIAYAAFSIYKQNKKMKNNMR